MPPCWAISAAPRASPSPRSPAAADAEGVVYSSTKVRERLAAGDPLGAARVLGRPWEIEGRVESGDKRGRLLGFPTANVAIGDYLQPALGVYAVKAGIDEGRGTRWLDGVANLGRRPDGRRHAGPARDPSLRFRRRSLWPPSPGGADRFHPARAQVRRAGGPEGPDRRRQRRGAGAAGRLSRPAARPCARRASGRRRVDRPAASVYESALKPQRK